MSTKENLDSLVGKTVVHIVRSPETKAYYNVLLRLVLTDGTWMSFVHYQDCCESVDLDDVDGALGDLVGSPITLAEEVSNVPEKSKDPDDAEYGSFTWTFYRLATVKGYVTLKFYGSSNGYYSEGVDFEKEEQ